MIASGNCESNGMRMLSTKKECEYAADVLELSDNQAYEIQNTQTIQMPQGCIYASYNWLGWASPDGHPDPSIPCGMRYSGMTYRCICSRPGKIS